MAEEKKDGPSDIKLLKDYFGTREGDTIREFAVEIKALTEKDKRQLVGGIKDGSLTY